MSSSLALRIRGTAVATLLACSLAVASAFGLHTVATPVAAVSQVGAGWAATHPTNGGT